MEMNRRAWTVSVGCLLLAVGQGHHFCLAFFSSAVSAATRSLSPSTPNTKVDNIYVRNNDEVPPGLIPDNRTPATSPKPSQSLTTNRAIEITQVLGGDFLKPVAAALFSEGIPENWNSFWSQTNGGNLNHAERLAACCERLGPTYVKFAQAVSSRPDIVPKALADALSVLQDDMQPFETKTAKEIIRADLLSRSASSAFFQANPEQLEEFLQSLSTEPVAAASVGQVYAGFLPGYGKVAVKVKRPGIREIVDRDAQLLRSVAVWLESIPAVPLPSSASSKDDNLHKPKRLIATELKSSVDEFMSRLYEELDYNNEALNMDKFATLYSVHRGTSKNVKVVVPEVLLDLCTNNVIIMEFIEGTKLTNVVNEDGHHDSRNSTADELIVAENLALVQLCIDCTLSQLLETGVLHADPHGGNLLKVARPDTDEPKAQAKSKRFRYFRRTLKRIQSAVFPRKQKNHLPQLGYLDFGMLSTVDEQVRDALVCAVVYLVFAREVESVAKLFGELQLLPDEVVNSPSEMDALKHSLELLFDQVLIYPDQSKQGQPSDTQIPSLRFDKLLDSLTRLVPRFRFDLPPYFLNNARALSTLEGIARSLDPTFSVLQVVYPYALNRLLRNPSRSPVVDETLQGLIRSKATGRIDMHKVGKLLDDAALITGYKRRKVLFDILRTRGGLKLTRTVAQEGLLTLVFPWPRRHF